MDDRTTFIFYDFEAAQDECIGQNDNGDINLHQLDFIVAHKVCF